MSSGLLSPIAINENVMTGPTKKPKVTTPGIKFADTEGIKPAKGAPCQWHLLRVKARGRDRDFQIRK